MRTFPGGLFNGSVTGRHASAAPAQMLINGAGATFPQQIYTKWFDEYRRSIPRCASTTRASAPGGGQKQILAETVDFGASDGPMSDENLAKAPRRPLAYPDGGRRAVVSYNLDGDPQIKLDGPTCGDLPRHHHEVERSGHRRQNPDVKLPDEDIVVVHRSDGSGTSFIFTDYLSSVSPDWKAKVGKGVSVKLAGRPRRQGQRRRRRPGQADPRGDRLRRTRLRAPEQAAVRRHEERLGHLHHADGRLRHGGPGCGDDPGRFPLLDGEFPGRKGLPDRGTTWLLVYAEQKDHAKGEKLVQFLKWAYTDGEKLAPGLDYAPCPTLVIKRVLERVKSIKY
jgi:phosphate transport system substrate-binding protein